jgi:hypothetical protein
MQETFVDPQTGWMATRKCGIPSPTGAAVIEETVTDPHTGVVYHSCRVATSPAAITEWIQSILESKEQQRPRPA